MIIYYLNTIANIEWLSHLVLFHQILATHCVHSILYICLVPTDLIIGDFFTYIRLTLVLSCAMKFESYPHDTQICSMMIESCECIKYSWYLEYFYTLYLLIHNIIHCINPLA